MSDISIDTASIGFEKTLWESADKLRGSMDAGQYRNVVLGLIFLKYISDTFNIRYEELLAEGDGFENDKDEYLSENVFYVPETARWSYISQKAKDPQIGKIIDDAFESIEKENKRLKNILPRNYSRPELDKRRLGEVVDLFTNIKMNGNGKDLLGRVYEYFLSMFASAEGKRGGEFYTASSVVKLLVEVLEPEEGKRVYDPCCGSGGMFVQSAKFIQTHGGNTMNVSVFGQESNPTTWKLAAMNLAIHGIEADLGSGNADTFHNDLHKTLRVDYVLANPPFNQSDWGQKTLSNDYRWKYGVPPTGNANYGWLQHIISKMAPEARAGVVLANGSLSSQTGGEGDIRKQMIEDGIVECIISMPTQLFYSTQIPVSLWFFSKRKKRETEVLFIDARNLGRMETRVYRVLDDADVDKIANTIRNWRAGKDYEDIAGFCKAVPLDEMEKQEYILTPGRYVGMAAAEEDAEPFDEKMTRLTSELKDLFAEGNRLESEVKKQLKKVGYEI